MDLNSFTFTGHLGSDPEMKYLSSGTAVATFRVAINSRKDNPCWIEVQCWGKTAENANQYLTKGSLVGITAELQMQSWESDDGQKRVRYIANVPGPGVVFLGPKSTESSHGETKEEEPDTHPAQQQGKKGKFVKQKPADEDLFPF